MKLPTPICVLGRGLLVATSLWLLVGPLALLQLGAWAWMLSHYSQESTFEQAVQETFSGKRPCEMCKLIDKVENADQEQQPLSKTETKDFKLLQGTLSKFALSHPRSYNLDTACDEHTISNPLKEVPSPPPREFV